MNSITADERKELERLRRFKDYFDNYAVPWRWSDGSGDVASKFLAELYQKAVAAMDKRKEEPTDG